MLPRNRQSYLNALIRANQPTPQSWHFATTQGMLRSVRNIFERK